MQMQGTERDVSTSTIFLLDWAVPAMSSLIRILAAVIIVEPRAENKQRLNPNIKSSMLETEQLHVVSLLICYISTCLAFCADFGNDPGWHSTCLWSSGRLRQLLELISFPRKVGTCWNQSKPIGPIISAPGPSPTSTAPCALQSGCESTWEEQLNTNKNIREQQHAVPWRTSSVHTSRKAFQTAVIRWCSWLFKTSKTVLTIANCSDMGISWNIFQIFEIIDQSPWHNENQSESKNSAGLLKDMYLPAKSANLFKELLGTISIYIF